MNNKWYEVSLYYFDKHTGDCTEEYENMKYDTYQEALEKFENLTPLYGQYRGVQIIEWTDFEGNVIKDYKCWE